VADVPKLDGCRFSAASAFSAGVQSLSDALLAGRVARTSRGHRESPAAEEVC